MPPSVRDDWYLDESSLLEELKRTPRRRSVVLTPADLMPPEIPGYSNFIEIQRGGQGVVYEALQQSTRRRVAVKALHSHGSGSGSNASLRRFEREIDVVASLHHPNIVRIYDSGVTQPPHARPYFVMELIEGAPLDEYIASLQGAHALRRVLELFAKICDAVNYAHQRGVLHRDLKPGNIRVDSQGEPHVLDFGLAKAFLDDERITTSSQQSALSVTGEFLGSLPWSSPEHADGEVGAVDIRSDVYSLGVCLYHAITGRFPYAVDGGVRQVLANVANAAPMKPIAIPESRFALDDEIETIVLKCLEKQPGRRYQSAGEMARDIRRYLAGEPIEAQRESAWYTMRTRLRRYRMAGAAGTLIAVILAAGALVTWQQMLQAREATAQAIEQQQIAEHERARAAAAFDDVRSLAIRFLFDVHDEISHLAGSRPAREMLVKTAHEYLELLAAEAGDDPQLLRELAMAHQRLGEIQGNPYHANLGDTTGALASYNEALAIRQRVLELMPDDLELQRIVADTYGIIGDMHMWAGAHDRALEFFEQARAQLAVPMEYEPNDAGAKRVMVSLLAKTGDVNAWMGRFEEALASYDEGRAIIEPVAAADPENHFDQLNLSVCRSKMGFALSRLEQFHRALEENLAALAIVEQVAQRRPNDATVKRSVSINENQVGAALLALGEEQAALEHFHAALAIAQELHEADPVNALALSDLAFTHNRVSDARERMGDLAGAIEHVASALELRRVIAGQDEANASFQRDLGTSLSMMARLHETLAEDDSLEQAERRAHLEDALESAREARQVFVTLREKGALSGVDTNSPENLAEQIARYEQALAQ